MDSGTKEVLTPILERAREQSDFGNGRYARNLIEKALMKQFGRLMKLDAKSVTAGYLSTLTAEDFEIQEVKPKQTVRRIGFA